MSNENHKEVEQLFEKAVDLAEAERISFLDLHTGNRPEIRREVEQLLWHFDHASDSLLRSPIPLGDTVTPDAIVVDGAPPEHLGRYPVIDELGRGGMGVVYRALDPQLEREIAAKVLPREVAGDPNWLERFRREARLLASINHPNIATVYSLEEVDDITFITMELVHGELLAHQARGKLGLDNALSIAQQIAAALEAAHKKGIVHRDLKPLNIMVTNDGRVKVLDFGLAHSVRTGPLPNTLGSFVGTPGYMSPEQLRGESLDLRTDLWSYGCVLFECLTGERAFPGNTVDEQITTTLDAEPDWTCLPSDIPLRVVDVMKRCLKKGPEKRLERISVARREIEEVMASRARPATPDTDGIRSAGVANNLPIPLTSFVGRTADADRLAELLATERLVTLVGPGGCGKSRLAIEVGRQALPHFSGGVWFVELASISDADDVPATIAAALDVHAGASTTNEKAITDFFSGRHALLILDNCEHVLTSTAPLAESLGRACESLVLLTTSRESLGVPGEIVHGVPSLAGASVQLFTDRATAVSPNFQLTDDNRATIELVCDRLDGIPLAIELAAARIHVLSVNEIAERLDNRFRFLTAGSKTALPRHKTLRALIDWSYEQLDEKEQLFFARLSVFVGGFTLEAAEAVCTGDQVASWEALDVLSRLVDKSLVEVAPTETTVDRVRFRMLETIRAYASDTLQDRPATETKYRTYFQQLTLDAEDKLNTSEQALAIDRLSSNLENLKYAIETGLSNPSIAPGTLEIAKTLLQLSAIQSRWQEGVHLAERVLGHPAISDEELTAIGHIHHRLGNLSRSLLNLDSARIHYDRAMEIWQETGNQRSQAAVLNNRGLVAHQSGDPTLATELYTRALALNREVGNRDFASTNLNNLGLIATEHDRLDEAVHYFGEALKMARELDHTLYMALFADNLATVHGKMNDDTRARQLHEESIALNRKIGNSHGVATTLHNLAIIHLDEKSYPAARQLLVESLTIKHEMGDKRGTLFSVESLADLAWRETESSVAVRLLAAADSHRTQLDMLAAPSQRRQIDRMLDAAKSGLDGDVYDDEWSSGRLLSIDEMVALALS